tara:strand:- start:1009 stop:1737 length:729 start_codon:yes stop_codon:yes gene_type:complete
MTYRDGLVSIVMPTHNQSDHITDALESIRNQTYPELELIVVIDGMDEQTIERVSDCVNQPWGKGTVRCEVHEDNKGTAAAINTGMAEAKGEYVTWVSSDNTMEADWLSTLVALLEDEPDVDAVYSSYWREPGMLSHGIWYAREKKQQHVNGPYQQWELILDENCPCGPAFLWRHDLVDRVGGQRGNISHDYDYWLRIEEQGKIAWIPKPLATYRVHDERVTITRAETYDAMTWRQRAHDRRA